MATGYMIRMLFETSVLCWSDLQYDLVLMCCDERFSDYLYKQLTINNPHNRLAVFNYKDHVPIGQCKSSIPSSIDHINVHKQAS